MKSEKLSKTFLGSQEFLRLLECSEALKTDQKAFANQILALEVTNKCNYSCHYCFEGLSCKNNDFLSIEAAVSAIDKLPSGSELRFFEGEPLLYFDFIERIVQLYPQHEYSIVTNGSLLTKETAKFLKEHDFAIGLSFDGRNWQESNRPSLTGNSYNEFRKAIRMLEDVEAKVGISTVVTKKTVPHLYDIHLEVFSEYKLNGWAYLLAYSEDLTMKDMDILEEQIFSIIDEFPVQHLMKINDLKKWTMKIEDIWPVPYFCGAGTCFSAIAVNGEERICPFFLREGSCFVPSIRAVDVDCGRCYIWDYCKGGCLALNKQGTGNTHKSHPLSCKKNQIYFKAGLKTLIKARRERR